MNNNLFVVVLYNCLPDASTTLNSLLLSGSISINNILILDNTETGDVLRICNTQYGKLVSFGSNYGLAYAYNYALRIAQENSFSFMTLFDQDSTISVKYINALENCILCYAGNECSPVVYVPFIKSYDRVISPFYFDNIGLRHYLNLSLIQESILSDKCYAINSFATFSVQFLDSIGGFDSYYWLDGLDFWLFSRVHKLGKLVVIIPAVVSHDLSLLSAKVSINRLSNIAKYEAAFSAETRPYSTIFVVLRLIVRAFRFHLKPKELLNYIYHIYVGLRGGYRRRKSDRHKLYATDID